MRIPFLWRLPAGSVSKISPQDLKCWLDEGRSLQIVDARTGLEYRQGTIGEARHAPLLDMPASMQRLELGKGQPVVVLCLSGHRSLPGTRWLRRRGYEAYSLEGGLIAWKRAGYQLNQPASLPASAPALHRNPEGSIRRSE
jgi:rhodanese-related sulfurtransferase